MLQLSSALSSCNEFKCYLIKKNLRLSIDIYVFGSFKLCVFYINKSPFLAELNLPPTSQVLLFSSFFRTLTFYFRNSRVKGSHKGSSYLCKGLTSGYGHLGQGRRLWLNCISLDNNCNPRHKATW